MILYVSMHDIVARTVQCVDEKCSTWFLCMLFCMKSFDRLSVWWLMGVVLMYIVVYEVFVCELHFYSEAMYVL